MLDVWKIVKYAATSEIWNYMQYKTSHIKTEEHETQYDRFYYSSMRLSDASGIDQGTKRQ